MIDYPYPVKVRCPRCRKWLKACGEILVEGERLGVYQCNRCTRPWEIEGHIFQTALTFALDADGNMLDGESGEPLPAASPSAN